MSTDFRTNQIQTNKIIASGSTGTGAKLLIYPESSQNLSNPNQGNIDNAKFNTSSIGTDVFLYVSGSANSKNTSNTNTVSVFGGDVVISGNLYSNGIQIGRVSGTNIGTGSLIFSGTGNNSYNFYTAIGGGSINVFNSGNHLIISSSNILVTGAIQINSSSGILVLSNSVVRAENIFNFFSNGSNGSIVSRRLWAGGRPNTQNVTGTQGWGGTSFIAPFDGEIVSMITHNSRTTGPAGAFTTYSIWKSSDYGVSWQNVNMSVSVQSISQNFGYITGSVPLVRGDLFGVEVSYNAAVTSNDACGLKAALLFRKY